MKRLINIIREMVSVNICAIVEVPSHTYKESENDFFFFCKHGQESRNESSQSGSKASHRGPVTGVSDCCLW